MIRPPAQTLEKSARDLSEKNSRQRGVSLEIFRGFRKIEEHRLRMWHNAGAGGREVARQRAELVDILFRELFDSVVENVIPKGQGEPVAVGALGGYGRRELMPFSDIDIMFLHTKAAPGKDLEEIIRQTLVALWDIGFKVGHSTRSINQAVKQADSDMITKTAMLESRFLTGNREIFTEFRERFDRDCVHGHEAAYIAWRLANQAEMRQKFGSTVFMQEPNVKSGMGGLRDYQNLLWISQVHEHVMTTAKLLELKILRDTERRQLEKGYDFLLRVRTQMHYLTGRASDNLTLQLQGRIANSFEYPQKNILRRCEAFMRDYYRHAREIHLVTNSAIEKMRIVPTTKQAGFLSIFGGRKKTEKFDGFIAKEGKLFPESRDIFNEDPYRMMRAFHHAQVRLLTFDADLDDLIRRRLRLVNRTFQYARAARETFFAILSRKGEVGKVLRSMHDLGFLGRYMPEFGALTCLVQHEFFHRYTADEHTLVCIEKLDSLLFTGEERLRGYRALFQKLEDPAILYLALLMHDTGKAANSRQHEDASAALAHKVTRRFVLSPERRRMLITLVNSHYTLSHTSQTRNLDDPATVEGFAKIIGNRQNLDALMLLTLADGMGTSDQNWSDWKENLVWTLYRRTREYLEGGAPALESMRESRTDMLDTVLRKLPRDLAEETEAHFHHMPERYFLTFDADQIALHIRLFHSFFETRLKDDAPAYCPILKWIERPEQAHSEVWICGWDRPRLLERIAGAFLSAQINILSADIFTRGDSLALDIFRVCNTQLQPVTHTRDIARVEAQLREALAVEEYDFSSQLNKDARMPTYRLSQDIDFPTRIILENNAHPVYTLLDIQTPDRLGLLYDLLRALGEAGISIELSRITTEMDVAMDSFYITGKDGKKLSENAAGKRLQRIMHRAAVRAEKPD